MIIHKLREYSEVKGAESCFVSLDKELADLGTYYKDGALLIGYDNENPIATIAIRRIGKDTCEAKRLYIKPGFRGKGYARVLMNEMLDRSRKLGFKEVTFTTKPKVMSVGYGLYKGSRKNRIIKDPMLYWACACELGSACLFHKKRY